MTVPDVSGRLAPMRALMPLSLPDLLEETKTLTDWYTLGVFLKMPNEELKDIDRRLSREGLQRCKIELFNSWMKRYPNASWAEMANALEKCNEIAAADRIRQCHLPPSLHANASLPNHTSEHTEQPVLVRLAKRSSTRPTSEATASGSSSAAEPEALKHSFSYLVNSIDTAALLPAALSRNLITDRQRTECSNETHSVYQRAETFFSYLQRAVNTGDYYKFHTFVQILQETGQAQIASHLRG